MHSEHGVIRIMCFCGMNVGGLRADKAQDKTKLSITGGHAYGRAVAAERCSGEVLRSLIIFRASQSGVHRRHMRGSLGLGIACPMTKNG